MCLGQKASRMVWPRESTWVRLSLLESACSQRIVGPWIVLLPRSVCPVTPWSVNYAWKAEGIVRSPKRRHSYVLCGYHGTSWNILSLKYLDSDHLYRSISKLPSDLVCIYTAPNIRDWKHLHNPSHVSLPLRGHRLQYRLVNGAGPLEGWVSCLQRWSL